ncbi:glycoside hydrolase 5 family protein [Simiduia agarivorans]|uniref:glycoside hydrolase 5 family protein n=1 Tax=Simiduia agarivorans TaxID=447471 RepID=UPI001FCB4AD3|nr:cellulase family glycosylhydrolase [Simiduia agarivorans]
MKVEGTQFLLDDQPYRFAGTNYWYGAYVGAEDPARLSAELDFLAAHKITNLRVLAVSEKSELTRAVTPAMLDAEGTLDATLVKGLDRFLAEAGKRDMKVVLFLTNFWQWSGGMTQYNQWFSGTPLLDPDTTGRWDDYMESSADFYTCSGCQAHYQSVIRQLVNRVNSVNGIAYKDDPTIMSWQLANEPRPGGNEYSQSRADAYVAWIDTSARLIKSLAPNQLVSTGSEGIKGSQESKDTYLRAHQSPYVDYMTVHLWIKNWGWFDIHNAETTIETAKTNALNYLREHNAMAMQLGKPLVLEEFGAERDEGELAPETSTLYRDDYYRTVFEFIEENTGKAFAGTNFWAFAGAGRAGANPELWAPGDDYLGDPPQEPQGLNGVFDSDSTTLSIIRRHADRIRIGPIKTAP